MTKEVDLGDGLSVSVPDDADEDAVVAMTPQPPEAPEVREVDLGEGLGVVVAENATDEEVEALKATLSRQEGEASTKVVNPPNKATSTTKKG